MDDAIAISLNLQYSMVFDQNNQRVPCTFHHLSPEDAAKFKSVIQNKTMRWGQESVTNATSCGTFLEVGGGQGSGKGALFISPFELGPFLGQ